MKQALNAWSYPVSRGKARKIMIEADVQAKQRKRYKVTTNSNHRQPVFDNRLNRKFDVVAPDQVYAQYASTDYRRLLKAHGFEGSMSRKGDCWDNAVVESFLAA